MDVAFLFKLLLVLLNPILWAAVGIPCGLYVFYRGFVLLRRKRLILNTPRSTVRGAALGLVEIRGKATAPYSIISPISQQDCYFYRAIAWSSEQSDGSGRWTKAAEESLCVPIFLDDGTGRMLLNPRGAELQLAATLSLDSTASDMPSGGVAGGMMHFLARHGLAAAAAVRVEESCIRPGQTIFVLGTLCENPARSADPRQHASMFGRLDADFVSAAAADLQRRGEFDFLHLPAVSETAEQPTRTAAETFDLQPAVMLRKGAGGDPFLISWRSEREVVLALAWKSALYIWGGPALALGCLWYLLSQLRPM
jgi:hypothetical protein